MFDKLAPEHLVLIRGGGISSPSRGEGDRSAFGMRVSIIPRGERERGRAESALNEEIYGPWRGWRDDRFMPTRIGSSGPRVGRRTSEGKNGRMDGLAFSTKP